MRILLEAYCCRHDRGSEPGQGWGWAVAVASLGHNTVILTRPRPGYRHEDHVPPGLHIKFVLVPSPFGGWVEKFFGQQWDYLLWKKRALSRAKSLHSCERFDVTHHLTFGSVLLGSDLWRLDAPFLYGPLGGGQTTPPNLLGEFTAWSRLRERFRNAVVRIAPRLSFVRDALRNSAQVLSTNHETAHIARSAGATNILAMSDTATHPIKQGGITRTSGSSSILWVGSDRERKGLKLALEAFRKLQFTCPDATLSVVGVDKSKVQIMASKAGVGSAVMAAGRVSRNEVDDFYRKSDLLLFTSLRDSFGGQVLEAMSAGLPVVGLRQHGLGDLVPDAAAAKIDPGSENLAGSLAVALERLLQDRELLVEKSVAALAFARENMWDERGRQIEEIYKNLACRTGIQG